MRKKIYQMVHVYGNSSLSTIYKWFMISTILLSLLPLVEKEPRSWFVVTDNICLVIYVTDYILRWITADYRFRKYHWSSFARYPFRFISVVDLLSLAALIFPLTGLVRSAKLIGLMKIFRIIRIFRYSKAMHTIGEIFYRSKRALCAVGSLAVGYVAVSALIVFCVEPDTFNNFFDAVYWSTISLTTVGYGDIFPVSFAGKIVAMLSSFFGIAIVALPAGIITAEYVKNVNEKENGENT